VTYMSSTVHSHFELAPLLGQLVGVEIEVEAHSALPTGHTTLWRNTMDNSLRGSSREYIIKAPSTPTAAKQAVTALYRRFERNNVVLKDSMRAGVHIHLNQQHKTLRQMLTFASLYWIFEDYLIKTYCGNEREGNLFCLRLSDAEAPIMALVSAIRDRSGLVAYGDDNLRYSSMNFCALARFGTLEFRALRTPLTPGPIRDWIDVLVELENKAFEFESPQQLIESFSGAGFAHMARQLLPTAEDIEEHTVVEAIRRIQPLAYLVDWETL
jgi:hypothetical protein